MVIYDWSHFWKLSILLAERPDHGSSTSLCAVFPTELSVWGNCCSRCQQGLKKLWLMGKSWWMLTCSFQMFQMAWWDRWTMQQATPWWRLTVLRTTSETHSWPNTIDTLTECVWRGNEKASNPPRNNQESGKKQGSNMPTAMSIAVYSAYIFSGECFALAV